MFNAGLRAAQIARALGRPLGAVRMSPQKRGHIEGVLIGPLDELPPVLSRVGSELNCCPNVSTPNKTLNPCPKISRYPKE